MGLYTEHRRMGYLHGIEGCKRYKWSDPILQREYDIGFDLGQEERRGDQAFSPRDQELLNMLRKQQGYKPKW